METTDPLVQTLRELFGLLRQRVMGDFSSYARDNGLTMAQFGTMLQIHHKGACGVSDIGSELGVTKSAASQMLDRLVQLHLITRSEDPIDRRVKQIDLTDKGLKILQGSNRNIHSWLELLAQSMTNEEQEHVMRSLAVLIDKARELESNLSDQSK